MKTALLIAGKDLKQRLRDRSAYVIGIGAPFLLAAIVSFAFGGDESIHFNIGIANEDQGEIGAGFVAAMEQLPEDTFEVMFYDNETSARKGMEADEVFASIVVPAGFTEAVMSQESTEVGILTNPDSPVHEEIARSIARGFIAEVEATGLAISTAVQGGALRFGADLQDVIDQASATSIPTSVGDAGIEGNDISSVSYFAPGMALFFVFFSVQQAPLSFIIERREHTLQRMLVAPIKEGPLIVGKFIYAFVSGMVGLIVLAATSSQLLGAEWGDPRAGLALAAATILSFMGITALVTLPAKTEESAGGIGSIVAVVLAMLGGSFFPLTQAPQWIRSLGLATPHGWAMQGVLDLTSTGGGLEIVTTNILVLVSIGTVTGGIAWVLARRLVRA